jgi:blue light- and temperature-responsive anti-repressor
MMAPPYSFAYQPIVDVERRSVAAFEALVRGPNGESAASVLGVLSRNELYRFDVEARQRAIELSEKLKLSPPTSLNLNLLPDSLDACGESALTSTVQMAQRCGIAPERIMLEISETETIANFSRFVEMVDASRSLGVKFAIDDFGAGYAGLNLLAHFQPEAIKIDMQLVRDIWHQGPRQAIVRGVITTCTDLGIDVVAEGVETMDEYQWLRDEGISLFQGYLFARPAFQALPTVTFPSEHPVPSEAG